MAANKPAGLTAEFLDEMKQELLARRKSLLHNINSELDDMREANEGHHLADFEDLSDASDETSYTLLEIESKELEQINHALDRIEQGTYGICEDLNVPISLERLRALPYATLSIEARRQREREEYGV